MAAEALEGPDVLRFHMAEQVAVAGLCQDAEEGFAGESSDPRSARWVAGCPRV